LKQNDVQAMPSDTLLKARRPEPTGRYGEGVGGEEFPIPFRVGIRSELAPTTAFPLERL
jgi:hypothetical protein